MSLQLILARVGAGKTQAVQDRLVAVKQHDPLAKAWVLLSGERQIIAFRQRLMERTPERPVFFNVEFFSFYTLYTHLLTIAGRPQRCLDDAARTGLLRAVCAAENLNVYGRIAHTAGFIHIIAEFIYELKQNLITPEALYAAAENDKERELAQIYAAYQRLLQQHALVDREGEGWLALEALRDIPSLGADVRLLLVDGYDQFNVLQAQLLAMLGGRTHESVVTLTVVKGREATIGRRFARAAERLRKVHEEFGLPIEVEEAQGYYDQRHPMLRHLSQHIFLPRPPIYAPPNDASPDLPALQLVEAPDMGREVGAVLRRVKALLLTSVRPDDVLIALRDWTSYGDYFAAQARMYGVPLALHFGERLEQNPAVASLLELLNLPFSDFRRRDLLDVLRSPYFAIPGLSPDGVDLLDRLSTEMTITGGRQGWLDGLAAAQNRLPAASDEDEESTTEFEAEFLAHTRLALSAFFEAITPPEEGSTETYVRWLEGLIGQDEIDPDDAESEAVVPAYTLSVPLQVRVTAAAGIVERDLAALNQFASSLRSMIAAGTLFESLGYSRILTRIDFMAELRLVIANASVQRSVSRDGRALVTTVTDARGLPHQHVFILGLSEGVFPAPVPEDPLLLDTERERLARLGIELSTQAERADDDGLFYELMNQAHESLTLSRPYTKDGDPWPESHLWRAVRTLFPDLTVERYRVGGVVPAAEAATAQEVALALADGASSDAAPALRQWLNAANPDYWNRIALGRKIEMGRISRQPYDHYAGRLRDETLIGHAAGIMDSGRVWSATQLGEYGICGFRFFAHRMLKLEAIKEPEDGMDTRQLGTLNHEILEATYRVLAEANVTITPDYTDFALETLYQQAARLLADAPRRLGFRASALWQQESESLIRRLESLVKLDFSGGSRLDKDFAGEARRPAQFEVSFGREIPVSIDLGGERLRVNGMIDRVDWQGDRAIVIDYKTGSTKIDSSEIARGRNFQMMLYVLAAEALFDAREVGGAFWHVSNRETSGKMLNSDPDDQAIIEQAKDHISHHLALGRAGDFATQANKLEEGRCARYCDYHQMCRMAIMSKRKRED